MPVKGYSVITIKDDLYQKLKITANAQDKSIQEYLETYFVGSNPTPRTSLKSIGSLRIFLLSSSRRYLPFKYAIAKTQLEITPKVLRFWFANEMAKLGVPDRFIDAFQGRIPRSVLARHYTDYSLEKLKQINDKAGLRVLPHDTCAKSRTQNAEIGSSVYLK
jgi:hypothetical protein